MDTMDRSCGWGVSGVCFCLCRWSLRVDVGIGWRTKEPVYGSGVKRSS